MSANLREVHLVKSIHAVLGGDESLLQFFFHHKRLDLRVCEEELLQEAQELILYAQVSYSGLSPFLSRSYDLELQLGTEAALSNFRPVLVVVLICN